VVEVNVPSKISEINLSYLYQYYYVGTPLRSYRRVRTSIPTLVTKPDTSPRRELITLDGFSTSTGKQKSSWFSHQVGLLIRDRKDILSEPPHQEQRRTSPVGYQGSTWSSTWMLVYIRYLLSSEMILSSIRVPSISRVSLPCPWWGL